MQKNQAEAIVPSQNIAQDTLPTFFSLAPSSLPCGSQPWLSTTCDIPLCLCHLESFLSSSFQIFIQQLYPLS